MLMLMLMLWVLHQDVKMCTVGYRNVVCNLPSAFSLQLHALVPPTNA